jgi:hypothetical protein
MLKETLEIRLETFVLVPDAWLIKSLFENCSCRREEADVLAQIARSSASFTSAATGVWVFFRHASRDSPASVSRFFLLPRNLSCAIVDFAQSGIPSKT